MADPGQPPERAERSDAQRNRAKVLAAAERLFQERGASNVTMEDVARLAGVGKGTLYRRYPHRAALAVALLDEHERRLQERIISGPPPLGPGAPAAQRLAAFYAGMVDLLDQHLDLALAAETGAARLRTGAYAFWRLHVQVLLRDAGIADPGDVLADVLLAPLASELHQHFADQGVTTEQRVAALDRLARRVLRAGAEPGSAPRN